MLLVQAADGFDAVHEGHFEIEQDDIGLHGAREAQGLIAVGSLGDDLEVGLRLQHGAQPLTHDRVVIGE